MELLLSQLSLHLPLERDLDYSIYVYDYFKAGLVYFYEATSCYLVSMYITAALLRGNKLLPRVEYYDYYYKGTNCYLVTEK